MKFSSTEKKELITAWLAVSLAFAILFSGGITGIFHSRLLTFFVVSAFTVGIGFLLHELAHKWLAVKYGCWAEFRSDKRMLLFMVLVSFFGFVFAAPGAVVIHGMIDRERHGKVAVIGPAVNLVLALLFLLGMLITGGTFGWLQYGFMINAWLGLFNMLPFWVFDGAKVFAWNKLVFGLVISIAALFVFFSYLP